MTIPWFLSAALLSSCLSAQESSKQPPSKQAPSKPEGSEQSSPEKTVANTAKAELTWQSATNLGLEGQGWKELKSPFDRLPKKAEKMVRPAVWNLSRHSAGLVLRFRSDAPSLHARWTLTSEQLAMPHMPATGVSGLDLYVRSKKQWRYCATGKPKAKQTETRLLHGIGEEMREYMLYLPLYNGCESLEIGVPANTSLLPAEPRTKETQRPIVFYGTSITQGGCASRPGMVHTAILGRKLDRPVINLGFSGNGRLEMPIAKLLSELDAAVFILDCGPNLRSPAITARLIPFVTQLRRKRPDTPILLVEDPTYSNAHLIPGTKQRIESNRKAMRAGFDTLVSKGLTDLHYLSGEGLYPADGSGTVDGVHPTDAGFTHQAKAFEPGLRAILSRER